MWKSTQVECYDDGFPWWGPAIVDDNEIDAEITKFDPSGTLTNKLIDTDNLPSVLTSNLDLMQGDNGFMNMK